MSPLTNRDLSPLASDNFTLHDEEEIIVALSNRPLEPHHYASALSNVLIAGHQQAAATNIGRDALNSHIACGKFSE